MNNDIFPTLAVAGFLICLCPPPALAAAIPQQVIIPDNPMPNPGCLTACPRSVGPFCIGNYFKK